MEEGGRRKEILGGVNCKESSLLRIGFNESSALFKVGC